jgi:uncharacterized MAPEG superfamily protein
MVIMNIPHLTIMIALALVYLPRFITAKGQAEQPEGYDNASPRDQQGRLEGLAKRALGAHMNGFESLASFAPAVLCAELAHVDPRRMTILCVAHVVARAVYVLLYLANKHVMRSVVWTVAFIPTVLLFVLSLSS